MEQTKQHKRAEDINVSYEEALNIAHKKLREKIQHRVIPVLWPEGR